MCPVSLKQGRYSWRHNSVLQPITTVVKNLATPSTEVFSDIEGHQINRGTIPADVLVTGGQGSKPDLVIVNRPEKKIALLELTCSHFSSADKAHRKKLGDYTQLSLDLSAKGFAVALMPFEVLSSGHITNRTRTNIKNTLRLFNDPKKTLFEIMAKISLLYTMSIFLRIPSERMDRPTTAVTLTCPLCGLLPRMWTVLQPYREPTSGFSLLASRTIVHPLFALY